MSNPLSEQPIECDLIPQNKDVVVISAAMTRGLHHATTKVIEGYKKNNECVVFLTTFGGDPDGAYRIARCLRHHYKDFLRIVVPSFCKSAGTLLVIAANELAIGDFGELGPLDVQVEKNTEVSERSSCLDIQEALDHIIRKAHDEFLECLLSLKMGTGISTKIAGEFAHSFCSSLFAPLMAQIDTLRMGEVLRAQNIAYQYGLRLNEYSGNLMNKEALMWLINGYPAHSFVIDRKEARKLFKNVSPLSNWEEEFFRKNQDILLKQADLPPTFYCNKEGPKNEDVTQPFDSQ